MPFQLPDTRIAPTPAPVPVLLPPRGRPIYTREQAEARINADRTWFRPLTHKQRRFVGALFANGFDIAQAALEADPTIQDERTARRIGNRWYALSAVKEAIEGVHTFYQESTKVRFDDLVDELRAIAFSSIADHVEPDGEPKLFDETSSNVRAIKSIRRRQTKYGEDTTIEMHDKLSAIDKLLKISAPKGVNVGSLDDKSEQGDTVVNVHTVNIIPVPQGHFLPAPPEPKFDNGQVINAMPIISNTNAAVLEHVQDD